MSTENTIPTTLREMIVFYSDPINCHTAMVNFRWPNGVACPHCGSVAVWFTEKRLRWQCKDCKKQFTTKVGTIFEDSPLPLTKWLPAVWLIVNCKNGISSCEIHRDLGVTQKTAWFMLHRIRTAMATGSFEKFSGTVEADETYIGGKEGNKHWDKRQAGTQGRSGVGKSVVMGIIQRSEDEVHSKVKAKVIGMPTKRVLHAEIADAVNQFATVYTDQWKGYNGLCAQYVHQFVNHTIRYAMGEVHTNGIENFWSLLKRGLNGTYVHVEPFHLKAYIDEQVFRFNNRKETDADRFAGALGNVNGKRLTYDALTTRHESYYDQVIPR